ncbi:ABC transporter substrate-binding protein [Amycolatopsis sp. FU40]|uniref:ABC transporter substrate-binding protein n=1 Tax=Amycolatopsis sp. FU40 TaxID=2914159 RepID=UPI001F1A79B5|nr:ABC transporter substrate-binding protein [Amycolatopsis sp. FU40]UKD56850.1 ABC transporter substrate-binding protein [Amycolatopsis sp. FU40]
MSRRPRCLPTLLLAAALLAGCSPPYDATAGGANTLRVSVSADAGESLNPYVGSQSPIQELRSSLLFEGLTALDPAGKAEWRLATGMTSNADRTQWTITLRPGVKFTDGAEFTSADVVSSIKYLRDPGHATQGLALIQMIDPGSIQAVDKLTVRVGLSEPFSPFKEIWASVLLPMTKTGSAPAKPIGTGPFAVKSFAPGRESTVERFDGYWGEKPRLDAVQLIEYPSQQAQANALLSGRVDIASNTTPTIAKSLVGRDGIQVLDSKGNFSLRIGLNTAVAPFSDVRVRQALRLLVDRQQIVSNVFSGYGRIANDYETTAPPCAAPDIPQRAPDIAAAKRLLAEAGQTDLSFAITTDGLLPGMSELAQVFAQNAAQAGVKVSVNVVPTPELLAKWGKWPAFVDYNPVPYLPSVLGSLLPDRIGNGSNWNDPAFVKLAGKLFSSPEQDQCPLMNRMHEIEHTSGPNITPAFSDVLMPHRPAVHGLVPDVNGRPLSFLTGVTVG